MQILLEKRAGRSWEVLPSLVSAAGFPSQEENRTISSNYMMRIEHFQMETTALIRRSIPPGTWAVSIDLMDTYLHIPIHPASRKFLRLSLEGTVYQFRALSFAISTASFVFANLMEIVAGHI